MVSVLSRLELLYLEGMTRSELIAALQDHAADLPADLLERLEEQGAPQLRMLLLAGRLIRVLRVLQQHP